MKKKMAINSKTLAALLAVSVAFGGVIGGTVAWLTTSTNSVVNTFTYGDINIDLTETWNTDTNEDGTNDAWEGKVVPGTTLTKDPKVTVKADSEACWLFVKIEENDWSNKLTYSIANGWTELAGVSGVYYREVEATTADTSFEVLANNQVTVSNELTKPEVDGMDGKTTTLTVTAYAVQKENIDSAVTAWSQITAN